MSRGIGEFEAIQSAIPEWLAVIIALFTQLGDVWFLAIALVVLYWTSPNRHREIATVVALLLIGIAVVEASKTILALPRPAEPLLDPALLPWGIRSLYEVTAYSGGYGFPSGHAVNATIVYLGLAAIRQQSTYRHLTGAGLLIALIALSRVILGVHYAVDVIVGMAIGMCILGVAMWVVPHLPGDGVETLFASAIGFATINVAVRGPQPLEIVLVGVTVGAFAGWNLVLFGRSLDTVDRPSTLTRPLLRHAGPAVAVIGGLVFVLDWAPLIDPLTPAALSGLVAVVVVIGPLLWRSPTMWRFAVGVRFWATSAWRLGRDVIAAIRRAL